jgi:hypothetical protein
MMYLKGKKHCLKQMLADGFGDMPQSLIDSLDRRLNSTIIIALADYIRTQREEAVRSYINRPDKESA